MRFLFRGYRGGNDFLFPPRLRAFSLFLFAQIVDVVPEVQSVSLVGLTAETVELSFLEQSITITIGTDTADDIQAALEALLTASVIALRLKFDQLCVFSIPAVPNRGVAFVRHVRPGQHTPRPDPSLGPDPSSTKYVVVSFDVQSVCLSLKGTWRKEREMQKYSYNYERWSSDSLLRLLCSHENLLNPVLLIQLVGEHVRDHRLTAQEMYAKTNSNTVLRHR